ncbi:hypothetical protein, partial [Klebsiella pneumoniae]|uniref:hypothetical protein n=1 Tax=Klebsiella pneumoniae TaxID=573 RepID=UPI001CF16349
VMAVDFSRDAAELILPEMCKNTSFSFISLLPKDNRGVLDAICTADLTQSQEKTGHVVFSRRSRQSSVRRQLGKTTNWELLL